MPWLPLEGGTLRFSLDGSFGAGRDGLSLELPLNIEVVDTTMSIGAASTRLDALQIPASIRGPMTAPTFRVDADELLRRLQAVGAEALVQGLASEFGVPSEALEAVLNGELDTESLLRTGEGLLQESGAVEDTLNEAERAAEEARRRATEGLRGLLPGGGRRGGGR